MPASHFGMNESLDIYLLIGQSNMAGRGKLGEVSALRDPRVFMYRDGRWIIAEEPLHRDKPSIAGVGLGMSFAMEFLHARRTAIGLVPCAVGGTPLSRWIPGADLYVNAVSVTKQAMSHGTLRGILWHQGESDSGKLEDASSYGQRFRHMIGSLRAELSQADVPVVAGELGAFLKGYPGADFFAVVNQHLRNLEQSLPAYGCVSAEGLIDNGDNLHFNAGSLSEFGRRYAARFVELEKMTGRS